MLSKEKMIRNIHALLLELESKTVEHNDTLTSFLKGQLTTYNDILGEEVPQELWERIEAQGIY